MRRAFLFSLLAAVVTHAADGPRRIVSLSPNMTEILYGIGAFPQVVGVSDYCTYPPEVRNLPSVGGWRNPSLEKLAGLRPDLVVLDEGQAGFIKDSLVQLGLPVLIVADRSVADIYSSIAALGRATAHQSEAEKLVATTRESLALISRKTSNLPRVRVVVIVDRTPGTLRDLYTATAGSFYAELVRIAGGEIVAAPAPTGYAKLNKENLLAADPDAILDFIHGAKSRLSGDPMDAWRDIPELKAVRNRRVYGVNEDFVPHASQRIAETAALFAKLLHPESQ